MAFDVPGGRVVVLIIPLTTFVKAAKYNSSFKTEIISRTKVRDLIDKDAERAGFCLFESAQVFIKS